MHGCPDQQQDLFYLQALTKWGGALLELAHFRQGNEAYDMIEQAVGKFEEALSIDSKRHDALWCLGNAYTSQGFLSSDIDSANSYFNKAGDCFKRAVEQEPSNESYQRALEMSSKAPQLYVELQRQLQEAGASMGSPRASSKQPGNNKSTAQKGKTFMSDFMYDIAGWGILVGLIFGVAALSRVSTNAMTK